MNTTPPLIRSAIGELPEFTEKLSRLSEFLDRIADHMEQSGYTFTQRDDERRVYTLDRNTRQITMPKAVDRHTLTFYRRIGMRMYMIAALTENGPVTWQSAGYVTMLSDMQRSYRDLLWNELIEAHENHLESHQATGS